MKQICVYGGSMIHEVYISFNNIKILLNNKIINIKGEKLLITKLDENEMLIKGVFKGIDFIDE